MTTTSPDLWHHFGRVRAGTDRAVPESFFWAWGQDGGPGAERLGELAGRRVADLGSGAARSAAHLVTRHRPARLDAVDASAAQHGMAVDLYGDLAPVLRLVHADAADHLRARPGGYDVLYSLFGAVDFTDPHDLLPAAATALRPGGRLVFATLAHCLGGDPALPDAVPVEITAKSPAGEPAALRRWVLQEQVWAGLLDGAGFTGVATELLPASGDGPRTADTLLLTAFR